jgi:hypothetical protein
LEAKWWVRGVPIPIHGVMSFSAHSIYNITPVFPLSSLDLPTTILIPIQFQSNPSSTSQSSSLLSSSFVL